MSFLPHTIHNTDINNGTLIQYQNQARYPAISETGDYDNTLKTIRFFVDTFILVFSLFGNILIVLTTCRMPKLRKLFTGFLIVNLAVCDILLVLFGVLPDMLDSYAGNVYSWSMVCCKVIDPLATCQVNTISIILLVISIERYVTIKHNKRPITGLAQQIIAIAFINLFAIATVLPYTMTLQLTHSTGNTSNTVKCKETWSLTARKNYTIILFILQIGAPLPIMIFLYLLSWRTIKHRNTKTIKVMKNITNSILNPNNNNNINQRKSLRYSLLKFKAPDSKKDNNNNKAAQVKRNISRMSSEASIARHKQTKYYLNMFTCVVVLFTVCMLPNQITWFYKEFEPKPLNLYVRMIFYWLTFSNAVLNPWIYAGFNPHFKRSYRTFVGSLNLFGCANKKRSRIAEMLMDRNTRTINSGQTPDSVTGLNGINHGGVRDVNEEKHIEGTSENTGIIENNKDFDKKSKESENSANFLWLTPWSSQNSGNENHHKMDSCMKTDPYKEIDYSSIHTSQTNTERAEVTNDGQAKQTFDKLFPLIKCERKSYNKPNSSIAYDSDFYSTSSDWSSGGTNGILSDKMVVTLRGLDELPETFC